MDEFMEQSQNMMHEGNYADAEAAFRKATEEAPEDEDAWFNLGLALKELSRYSDAEQAYKRGLSPVLIHLIHLPQFNL